MILEEENMKRSSKRILRIALSVAAAMLLIAGMAVSSFAAEANEKVNEARNGVVQIRVLFQGNDGDVSIKWGSGFLVNDMTVMTCYHVAYVDDETIEQMRENEYLGPMVAGKNNKQIREKMIYKVTVYTDSSVTAVPVEGVESGTADFVALKLQTPLTDYKPIPVRDTKENPVEPTESCFVLGFPQKMQYFNEAKYSQDKVEVSPGTVKKMDVDTFRNNAMTIFTSEAVTPGYSGGPMVDSDGNIIGIAYAAFTDDKTYSSEGHATASQEFLPVLKTIGIDYTAADGSSIEDDPKEDTEEKDVPPLTTQTEEQTKEEKKPSMLPFIIGGIAALVIIIVVVILLLTRKKKDNAPASAGTYTAPSPTPVVPPTGTGSPAGAAPKVPPAYRPKPDTDVLGQGSSETTVLNQGAGETTVLSANQVGGSLTRSKTGEKINITRENFKIGKERSKVDYCVSDNSAVSRHHATIVTRGNDAYLVDNNSRNFTFVNDVKISPNSEFKLNNGDKITFGDEVYTYNK